VSNEVLDSGWDSSAGGWIDCVDRGDRNREFLLDAVMLKLTGDLNGKTVLDVGCGEGRFCRMMSARGAKTFGLDPTTELVSAAQDRHSEGTYLEGWAEDLPFEDKTFDLVTCYLVLIDIPDYRSAIREMGRVLRPGGKILVANINPFASTRSAAWYRNEEGKKLHVAVEDYYDEKHFRLKWAGVEIINYHRPLESYMSAFLDTGLILREYLEPRPTLEAVAAHPEMIDERRVPLFNVMLWQKPS
jgi:ubiquinone/menaquinone biosynthesis C-methylase UbiE